LVQVENSTGLSGYYWGAFLFVSATTLPSCWVVSWLLKQLPGVNDIM